MAILLEVIEFFDTGNRAVVHRVPQEGSADIPYGSQLIVQQNQEAVFFREGRALDVFGPGRHTLTTASVPIISRLLTMAWNKSPFRALVYFVGKQTFVEQKWGTQQPITVRDDQFGAVRLRGYGTYSFRVTDSTLLINSLVGSQKKYTTDQVSSFLREVIVSRLTDLLGTLQIPLMELSSRFDDLGAAARVRISDEFAKHGLELVDFFISALTPPKDVQDALDASAGRQAAESLRSYTLGKAARSFEIAGLENTDAESNRGRAFDFGDLVKPGTDPRQLVRRVATSAGWELREHETTWQLIVPLDGTRRQTVHTRFDRQDRDGSPLISFSSTCGPATEENAMSLLRYNSQLVHSGFAVESTSAGEMVVVSANQLADTADPVEITRAVAAVAWQADEAERRLAGGDRF